MTKKHRHYSSRSEVEAILTSSLSSSSSPKNEEQAILDRKVTLVTEGFTTAKVSELILRDRSRLSKENALTVCDYIISMKREINPRLCTIRTTIQFLAELSRSAGFSRLDEI
jgi:plasmid stability protein